MFYLSVDVSHTPFFSEHVNKGGLSLLSYKSLIAGHLMIKCPLSLHFSTISVMYYPRMLKEYRFLDLGHFLLKKK